MELNRQVFKAPGIPKIGKKSVSSSKIRGALNPQAKLRSSTFSFVRPVGKNVDTEKISGGTAVASNLAETNQILVEIQNQLAIDFAYRIAEEKRAIAAEKKKIAAQKVADKESRIEKGGRNLLGKTFSKVTAPFKSIFQKLIDFFSIILTGILFNTAFKWLSKEENRKKLKEFFNFLKDYWQELLIIFGAYKLARLVGKIYNIGRTFRKLFDVFKKKPPQLPCKCPPKSGAMDCNPVKDCVESLVKDPKRNKNFLNTLAAALLTTQVFSPILPLLKPKVTEKEKELQYPTPEETAAEQKRLREKLGPAAFSSVPYGPGGDVSGSGRGQARALPSTFSEFKSTSDFGSADTLPTKLREYLPSLIDAYNKNGKVTTYMDTPYGRLVAGFTNTFDRTPQFRFISGLQDYRNQKAVAASMETWWFKSFMGTQEFLNYASALQLGLGAGRLGPRFNTPARSRASYARIKQLFPTPQKARQFLDKIKAKKKAKKPLTPEEQAALDAIGDYYGDIGYQAQDAARFRRRNNPEQQVDPTPEQQFVKRSRGGTIFGQGSGLVDSVKALLAPGEEVIRASMAKLFRPLLKNINDKGGKEWLAFSGGVSTLLLNNRIQAELNRDFKKVIVKFTELVEEQIATERKKRRRNNSGGNGGNRPQTAINLKKPAMPQRSGGGSDLGVNMMQNIVVNQTPVSVSNNVLQPSINKSGIVVVPITVGDLQAKKQQPKVNVINLPPKTVNLAPKQGSVKTPSSGSATEVPSISPVDAGNPYISSLRLEYGMVM